MRGTTGTVPGRLGTHFSGLLKDLLWKWRCYQNDGKMVGTVLDPAACKMGNPEAAGYCNPTRGSRALADNAVHCCTQTDRSTIEIVGRTDMVGMILERGEGWRNFAKLIMWSLF